MLNTSFLSGKSILKSCLSLILIRSLSIQDKTLRRFGGSQTLMGLSLRSGLSIQNGALSEQTLEDWSLRLQRRNPSLISLHVESTTIVEELTSLAVHLR